MGEGRSRRRTCIGKLQVKMHNDCFKKVGGARTAGCAVAAQVKSCRARHTNIMITNMLSESSISVIIITNVLLEPGIPVIIITNMV